MGCIGYLLELKLIYTDCIINSVVGDGQKASKADCAEKGLGNGARHEDSEVGRGSVYESVSYYEFIICFDVTIYFYFKLLFFSILHFSPPLIF